MAMVSAQAVTEYQAYLLGDLGCQCIRLATLPPSCASCIEILGPKPSGALRACPGLHRDSCMYLRNKWSWLLYQVFTCVVKKICL